MNRKKVRCPMEIKLYRDIAEKEFTMGKLSINGISYGYTCEDEKRMTKVKGETAIPAGRYRVIYREVDSDMTRRYKKRFAPWFKWHLWVTNVPGFNYIYLHVGNTPEDSDGCILIGAHRDISHGVISTSVDAYKTFYRNVSSALDNNEEVWLNIEESLDVKSDYQDKKTA